MILQNSLDKEHEKKVWIETDKSYYYSGDEVKGNIHLNITTEINPQKFFLKIKFFEYVQQKELVTIDEAVRLSKTTVMKSKKITEPFQNEILFYNHKIPIFRPEEKFLPQGQYSIPFEFKLNENLPSSFYFKDSEILCQIKYLLELEYENEKKIEYTHEFQVIEASKIQNSQNEFYQILNPKSCFCIPMGNVSVRLKSDKQQYCQGEIAKLFVEADNRQSKINLPTITGYLYNYLKIQTKWGHSNTIIKLCGITEVQGVQAGETTLNTQRKEMTLKLVDLNDSHQLQPTTTGQAIVNQYCFKIISEPNGVCLCSNQNLEIELPIQIAIRLDNIFDQKVTTSNQWNPKILNKMQIVFDDQYLDKSNEEQNLIPVQMK